MTSDDGAEGRLAQTQSRNRTRDPDDTQRRLLGAGLATFSRKGYAAASVDEIVKAAGCSKGTFYCHFGSKEELFLTLLASRGSLNHQRMMELCPWKGSCSGWVTDVLCTMVGFGAADPVWRALGAEFMAHGLRDPAIGDRMGRTHDELRRFISSRLRACLQDGARMAAEPETIAAAVVALLDGLALHTSLEPERLPVRQTLEKVKPLLACWFPEEKQ